MKRIIQETPNTNYNYNTSKKHLTLTIKEGQIEAFL